MKDGKQQAEKQKPEKQDPYPQSPKADFHSLAAFNLIANAGIPATSSTAEPHFGASIRPHTDFNRKKDPIFEAIF